MDERPRFQTPADWLAAYEQSVREGRPPWPPCTRDELQLADDTGILRPEWRPCRQGLQMLGLPEDFGRPVKPFPEAWRHRFIETLADDQDFTAAASHHLTGGNHG